MGPGDRVAIVAPNTVEYALTFWATTALGAITVGLNGWWTGEEIAYAVELTEPKVLFGDRRRLERLEGVDLADGLPVLEFERRLRRRSRRTRPTPRSPTSPSTRTIRSSSSSPAAPPGAPRV